MYVGDHPATLKTTKKSLPHLQNARRLLLCSCTSCLPGSFAGLGFLSWYLAGKMKAFDRRGHVAKLCIVLLPLLLATMVAISRVDDYWHHWQDVFAVGILGRLIDSFSWLSCPGLQLPHICCQLLV